VRPPNIAGKFLNDEYRLEDMRPMNKGIRTLTLTAIVATFALPAFAQTPTPTTGAAPAATAGAPHVDE
jgi:hypothetical protein